MERGTRNLPRKSRDTLSTWVEFGTLGLKYNAVNLTAGIPSLDLPEFLREEFQKVANENHNHYTHLLGHPELS